MATDYIHGENYEYSYLLENYNTSWTELQKDNEVVFTKLPYGNYVLKVRYKNDVFDSDAKEYFLHIRGIASLVSRFLGHDCLWFGTGDHMFGYRVLAAPPDCGKTGRSRPENQRRAKRKTI